MLPKKPPHPALKQFIKEYWYLYLSKGSSVPLSNTPTLEEAIYFYPKSKPAVFIDGKFAQSPDTITRVAVYTRAKWSTSFEIELPPHGSTFVVFNNTRRSKLTALADLKGAVETPISGPWKVIFLPIGALQHR